MIGKLSKNFHGVGIGPLSIILAVKSMRIFFSYILNWYPSFTFDYSLIKNKYVLCSYLVEPNTINNIFLVRNAFNKLLPRYLGFHFSSTIPRSVQLGFHLLKCYFIFLQFCGPGHWSHHTLSANHFVAA